MDFRRFIKFKGFSGVSQGVLNALKGLCGRFKGFQSICTEVATVLFRVSDGLEGFKKCQENFIEVSKGS